MNLREVKCPNCGATVKVNPDAKVAICMYCQSEYVVEDAINLMEQNVENQTVNGQVSVATQVVQNQTIINNQAMAKKYVVVPEEMSYQPVIDMRWSLIQRKSNSNNQFECLFERDLSFNKEKDLLAIENQVFALYDESCKLDEIRDKKKKKSQSSAIGVFILCLFIPIVGWTIAFFLLLVFIVRAASLSSTNKQIKQKEDQIKSLSKKWLEIASARDLI